ncbi:MAG: NAD(P)-dependent oxidoreductase [Enterococcus sp.]
MYRIHLVNELSDKLTKRLAKKQFSFGSFTQPNGIFVRSTPVPENLITKELHVIGRSGIGVNTINIPKCTENGTVVFNTPGVNANAVKELVLTCLLLSVRPVMAALQMVQTLPSENLLETAEQARKAYVGEELLGKTVGLLGLGAIGDQVAKACSDLGMDVIGYARRPRNVEYFEQVQDLKKLLTVADFIIILLPLTQATEGLISEREFAQMKRGTILLNFGRGPIVDNQALLKALDQGQVAQYISDFPSPELLGHEKIWLLPHIGGTTKNALGKGDQLTLSNMREYLLFGTVRESVNFPNLSLPFTAPMRLTLYYHDRPKVLTQISKKISDAGVEIDILSSDRKDEYVYTIIDLDEADTAKVERLAENLSEIPAMVKTRVLKNPNWAPTIYL